MVSIAFIGEVTPRLISFNHSKLWKIPWVHMISHHSPIANVAGSRPRCESATRPRSEDAGPGSAGGASQDEELLLGYLELLGLGHYLEVS